MSEFRCPNCESAIDEEDGPCPECDHLGGVESCHCRYCEEQRDELLAELVD